MTGFYEEVEIGGKLTILPGAGNGIEASGTEFKNVTIWQLNQTQVNALTVSDVGKILFNTSTAQFGIRIASRVVYMNDLEELTGILAIANGGTGLSSIGSSNQFLGVNAAGNALEYKTVEGTANQIITTNSAGKLTLSLPQSINSTAAPTFAQILLNNAPTDASHLVRKQDLEAVMLGMQPKDGCVCATTANITLSGLQTIDGYITIAGDRVLVKNQSTASQNGVYVASAGAWSRATDLDVWSEFYCAYIFVDFGTANGDTGWRCTVGTTGTLGSTDVTFVKFTSIGQILVNANSGLTKTNNNLSINVDGSTIEINNNILRIKSGNLFKTYTANLPVKTAGATITMTHGLGTVPTLIAFRRVGTKSPVFPNITSVTTTQISCTFSIDVPASTFEVVCGVIA